jgi:hypothetical protein
MQVKINFNKIHLNKLDKNVWDNIVHILLIVKEYQFFHNNSMKRIKLRIRVRIKYIRGNKKMGGLDKIDKM